MVHPISYPQARLFEVQVVLDAVHSLVADHALVAQFEQGPALRSQQLPQEALVGGGAFLGPIFVATGAGAEAAAAVVVEPTHPLGRLLADPVPSLHDSPFRARAYAGAVSSSVRRALPLPSIISADAAALASAKIAAATIATRNPATNDSATAPSTLAAISPLTPSGTSAAPRSTFSASSCWRACAGRSRLAVCASRAAENVRKTKIPSSGIAKSPAARETALFTPEASPECLPSAELIAVVVSGAMTNDIPSPSTTTAGKNVVQYEPVVPGMAKRTKPVAAITGPMMSGSLAPYRVTKPPAHRDIRNVMMTNGRKAPPAAVAE